MTSKKEDYVGLGIILLMFIGALLLFSIKPVESDQYRAFMNKNHKNMEYICINKQLIKRWFRNPSDTIAQEESMYYDKDIPNPIPVTCNGN